MPQALTVGRLAPVRLVRLTFDPHVPISIGNCPLSVFIKISVATSEKLLCNAVRNGMEGTVIPWEH